MTAVALALLGRPLDRPVAVRGDADQASCSTGDDLVLSSGRRGTPSIRMGDPRTEEDGALSVDIGPGYTISILVALPSELAFATANRHAPRLGHPSAWSARGPPSLRA